MPIANSITSTPLGGLPERYTLNVLIPLQFLLQQDEHDEAIQSLLDITQPDVTLEEFKQAVNDDVQHLLSMLEQNPELLSKKPLSGRNLNPFMYLHGNWGLNSMYISYDFANKSFAEIKEVYNPRIGNMILEGIKQFALMKQMEKDFSEADKYSYKFYEQIEIARTRCIEFLIAGSLQNSKYFDDTYLTDNIDDLFLNFLGIQNSQPQEAENLYVVKTKDGMVMKYENILEEVSFQALTFRVLSTLNSLNNFNDGHRKALRLKYLEPKKQIQSRYGSKIKTGASISVVKELIVPITEELEENLQKQMKQIPRVLPEEKLELMASLNHTRRDNGATLNPSADGAKKEDYIPSPFNQSRRDRAVSAKIVKNILVLASDYGIPPIEMLREFIAALPLDSDEEKLLAMMVILSVALGCRIEDVIGLLQDDEKKLFYYNDGVVRVKIDGSIFASPMITQHLEASAKEISFKVPHLCSLLISLAKKLMPVIEEEDDDATEALIEKYKLYLADAVAKFPKRISISPAKTHRYLKSFIKLAGADAITAYFTTATYHQNDIPKMVYTSMDKNSLSHFQLFSGYWIALDADVISRKILGIPDGIFATESISITNPSFAGSSNCVVAKKSKAFFRALDDNIRHYTLLDEGQILFNLVSIKIGYSSSILVGTRSFKNSKDFRSWSHTASTLTISEKASSAAAGLRVVPLCQMMNDGYKSYSDNFLEPLSLEKKICLLDGENTLDFSKQSVYKTLKGIPKLHERAVLEEYVQNVPLNTGRHCFTQKAISLSTQSEYISTFMGHNFSGSEQFGIYSTLNITEYAEAVRYVSTTLANEHGIKDLSW